MKKEVISVNEFGICPKCGYKVVMLASDYNLYGLSQYGSVATKHMKSDSDFTVICPKCGFKHSFVIFFDQFVPKEYYKVQDHNEQLKSGIDDWKIIGYIDEKH